MVSNKTNEHSSKLFKSKLSKTSQSDFNSNWPATIITIWCQTHQYQSKWWGHWRASGVHGSTLSPRGAHGDNEHMGTRGAPEVCKMLHQIFCPQPGQHLFFSICSRSFGVVIIFLVYVLMPIKRILHHITWPVLFTLLSIHNLCSFSSVSLQWVQSPGLTMKNTSADQGPTWGRFGSWIECSSRSPHLLGRSDR